MFAEVVMVLDSADAAAVVVDALVEKIDRLEEACREAQKELAAEKLLFERYKNDLRIEQGRLEGRIATLIIESKLSKKQRRKAKVQGA